MSFTICKRQLFKIIALITAAAMIIGFIVKSDNEDRHLILSKQFLQQMICDAMPVFYTFNYTDTALIELVPEFDLKNPVNIIKNNIYALASANEPPKEKEEPVAENMADAKPIKEIKIGGGSKGYYETEGVLIKNNTTYDFDPAELMKEPLIFDFKASGPLVMIVHSHSSESYTATDKNYYLPTDPDRTEDINYNVVRVGTQITERLKANGIDAVHDTALHDYPSYNGSYKSSLASVEKYLKKYPSIRLVIDIHRDSMVQADGTKLKLAAEVGEKKAAQIMLLTGSNQGGLDHPNWRENLKFAIKLQKTFNTMYPGLTRPVSFTKERYNTHTTPGSIIIEVGTTGNTLEEALVSADMIGNALAEFVSKN